MGLRPDVATVVPGQVGGGPDDVRAPMAVDEVFRRAPVPLALVDAENGTILAANEELGRRLGQVPEGLIGRRWPAPLGGTTRELRELLDGVRHDGTVVIDQRMGTGADAVSWRQHVRRVDPVDEAPYLIVQASDRTEEHRHASALQRLVERDELTGVWNRRRFGRELRRALGEGATHGIGLVLFDVDGFKGVNDAHGHAAGDAALVAVAGALVRSAPEGALVARLAGDEFAVLVVGATDDETEELCLALTQRARSVEVEGLPRPVRLSAGWTIASPGPEPDKQARDAMIEADVSMYAAKARTRSGSRPRAAHTDRIARTWWPDPAPHEMSALELWAHPVVTVSDGRLALHDVVLLAAGELAGEPQRTEPELSVAGLVELLDRIRRDRGRRIATADRYLVHLPQLPPGLGAAVSWVRRAADESGLDPASVTFALAEDQVLAAGSEALPVLASLDRAGFGIAVDEFGATVGSLRLLGALDLDQVWLARTLAAPLETDSAVRGLVEAVVRFAHRGSTVVGLPGTADVVAEAGRLGIDLVLVPDASELRALGGVGAG